MRGTAIVDDGRLRLSGMTMRHRRNVLDVSGSLGLGEDGRHEILVVDDDFRFDETLMRELGETFTSVAAIDRVATVNGTGRLRVRLAGTDRGRDVVVEVAARECDVTLRDLPFRLEKVAGRVLTKDGVTRLHDWTGVLPLGLGVSEAATIAISKGLVRPRGAGDLVELFDVTLNDLPLGPALFRSLSEGRGGHVA